MLQRALKFMPDPLVRLLLVAIALATVFPAGGEAQVVLSFISSAAVFVLFLLNGLRLPRHEVLAGLANVRLLVPLVLWVFGAMTLAGLGMARLLDEQIPPLLALGFLYLGCLPSTVQSATAYVSVAKGNIAASVVCAALTNILGVFVTAPLFTALAGSGEATIDGRTLVKVITILLLPFVIGQFAQRWAGNWVTRHRQLTTWMDRSSIAIAVYAAFSGAIAAGLWTMLDGKDWMLVLGANAVFLLFGFGGAWLLGGLVRLERGTRITLLFSGSQKSIAMGAPLATVLFPPNVAGVILVPIFVYHLAQLLISAPMATRLGRSREHGCGAAV